MNATANHAQAKPASNVPTLAEEFNVLRPELEKVLPAHISVDKFMRVVNTAISQNPDLYKADRRSLFTSCVKCATDGLVPDGREAALVIYNTKQKYTDEKGNKAERWIQAVQYMPMVYGIQKKVRNSGELQSLACNPVFEADNFRYFIDDVGEHILHEPNLEVPDRGKLKAVYAQAKTKDGGVYTEVMTRGQVEQVRAASKTPNGPAWSNWYDEMARKSVIRRLSKRLPMSTDIQQTIQRMDENFDFRTRTASAETGVAAAKQLLGITPPAAALTHDADDGGTGFVMDTDTGEVIEAGQPQQQASGSAPAQSSNKAYEQLYTPETAIAKIRECTTKAQADGVMAAIDADYTAAGLSAPTEVHGAYTSRLAAIEQMGKRK